MPTIDQKDFLFFEEVWPKITDLLKDQETEVQSEEKSYLGNLFDVDLYIVDGDYVKEEFDMAFVEGGNDLVYDFIPDHELWVDSHIDQIDYSFILFHEFVERYLMANYNLDYDSAHEIADEEELKKRKLVHHTAGKIPEPFYQYDPEGGGSTERGMLDGMRDHTDQKGVPFMPGKGLYSPGADVPQTPELFYGAKLVVIQDAPSYPDYLIKDLKRIPSTVVRDPTAKPLQVLTSDISLYEVQNLLKEYGLSAEVYSQRNQASRISQELRKIAKELEG